MEIRPTYFNEPGLVEETPDKFSITNILAANLPYERTYSSTKVKNAPRKSKELVISNLEDYCSGDRSEMLTVLEYMNFTEPIFRDSTFSMEQTNNNIDIDETDLDPPLMESTCLDLCKEANDDYDTEMSLLIDQIIGSEASKHVAKNTLPVLVSTVNV